MSEKIIGNIVGVPNPKSDWNQTDPTKADYIKNKPTDTLDRLGRIAHYGDADIIPSDSSLFKYSLNDDGQSYTIEKKSFSLSGEIVIPYEYNGLPITKISSRAFDSCNRLKSVTIPEGVTSIGDYAFEYSTNLKSVTIPDSVIYIGRGAFYDTSLKNITIPNGVAEIAYGTFRLCTNLTSITIPDSVIYIGEWAFRDCESFNDVYYEGTKEQWDAITVEKNLNSALLNANIHYDWNPAMKGELSETYATKKEIGDRSQLIDAPNNDLVTAINRAWNNAETARNMVNTLDTDVSTLREEVGNIGTALDGIIAIQNTLIGGGSV